MQIQGTRSLLEEPNFVKVSFNKKKKGTYIIKESILRVYLVPLFAQNPNIRSIFLSTDIHMSCF